MRSMTPHDALSNHGHRPECPPPTLSNCPESPDPPRSRRYAFGGRLEPCDACDMIVAGVRRSSVNPRSGLGIMPGFRCMPAMVRVIAKFQAIAVCSYRRAHKHRARGFRHGADSELTDAARHLQRAIGAAPQIAAAMAALFGAGHQGGHSAGATSPSRGASFSNEGGPILFELTRPKEGMLPSRKTKGRLSGKGRGPATDRAFPALALASRGPHARKTQHLHGQAARGSVVARTPAGSPGFCRTARPQIRFAAPDGERRWPALVDAWSSPRLRSGSLLVRHQLMRTPMSTHTNHEEQRLVPTEWNPELPSWQPHPGRASSLPGAWHAVLDGRP